MHESGSVQFDRWKGVPKSRTRQEILEAEGGKNKEVILGKKQIGYCKVTVPIECGRVLSNRWPDRLGESWLDGLRSYFWESFKKFLFGDVGLSTSDFMLGVLSFLNIYSYHHFQEGLLHSLASTGKRWYLFFMRVNCPLHSGILFIFIFIAYPMR